MIPFLTAALLAAAHPAPRASADPVVGTWMNAKGTVAVRTQHCGPAICGRVAWAAPAAQEAAAAAGTIHLVGTEVLHALRPAGRGLWAGEMFVPDMALTADGEMALVGPDTLEINGCRLGGLVCKRQVWHRIAVVPRGR
jgi:uncharacterized protein (DUF2147 family)